ncbi:anti-repressor SinI family protein [Metabacillus flavus]|nr:anti-repressor SinI family protein [Metabacillus flavus]
MENVMVKEEMDLEWKELILAALEMGISKEDIRHFLQSKQDECSN